jgi:hypothetical protein
VEKIDSLVIAEKQMIQQMCCDEITQIQSRQLLNQEIVMKNMDKILNVKSFPLLPHICIFQVFNDFLIRTKPLDLSLCCKKATYTVSSESIPS